jgi:carbon-monoxide dehydrogenase large subunit
MGIFEIAARASLSDDLPPGLRQPLAAQCEEASIAPGFPYGCQVSEVEIDPATGTVELVACSAVDDVGRAINPLILHGQAHGSIAQGMGQALFEQCWYDKESGQLLSASFQDYCIPRADTMPSFATEIQEVRSPTNPLGVRAGGEGATAPALASLVNAVVDALAEFGIKHIEMPVTRERVWRAIQASSTPVQFESSTPR